MNELTVLQASQGLLRYLQEQFPSELSTKGVVVGYDGRHQSRRFAEITAAVFLSQGVRVFLYSVLVPTPFVPFGVLALGAVAGVMVTASHNPKQDNGYKVYWADGCQIVEPHDRGIAAHILANLAPWSTYEKEFSLIAASTSSSSASSIDLLIDPTNQITESYFQRISTELCFHQSENASGNPKIVFTPMHGVGGHWMSLAFRAFGLPPFIPVPLQMQPDPEFPTVAFPNPEEGKGALSLAMQAADEAEAPLIIANDPDADRLAVAERQQDGAWRIFSGNEIGALLAAHMWDELRKQMPDVPPAQCFMVNSTVSSKFIQAMASAEGFSYEETLTGFKWIGSAAIRRAAKGQRFLFAFEEAIGFLCGTMGWDKDGVRAGAVFCEMAGRIYASGLSVQQRLQQLYEKYGHFVTQNSYFFNDSPAVMYRIFARMRTLGEGGNGYPDRVGEFPIRAVRDLATGVDSSQPDGKAVLPVSKSSPMTTFYLENGAVVTIRGSGTEPKLKYYAELHGSDPVHVAQTLANVVQAIITEFIQPEQNGLRPPAH